MEYKRTHNISRFVGILIELFLWLRGIWDVAIFMPMLEFAEQAQSGGSISCSLQITSDSGQRQSHKTQCQQIDGINF